VAGTIAAARNTAEIVTDETAAKMRLLKLLKEVISFFHFYSHWDHSRGYQIHCRTRANLKKRQNSANNALFPSIAINNKSVLLGIFTNI